MKIGTINTKTAWWSFVAAVTLGFALVGCGGGGSAGGGVSGSSTPGAPTIGAATAGNASATVSFTQPANNGGAAIIGYTVTSSPGNITATGATSPITITGLTNNTAYTFTAVATNSVGNSTPSATSNSVTPIATGGGGGTCGASTSPWAPTIVLASGSSGSATVYFNPPVYNGGSAITGYTVISNPAGGVDSNAGTTGLIHTVTGLTNGTTYTFTVTATNCLSTSAASTSSGLVIPGSGPGAPTNAVALAGDTQALVSFTPPANTGAYSIINYYVFSNPGNIIAWEIVGSGSAVAPLLVTGLTNGTSYTFTVFAFTGAGAGPASVASNAITPIAVPDRPTSVTATAGNATATVNFVAPANVGGSAIMGYTVTSSPAGGVDSNAGTTGLSHAITGLTNGTAYTFKVTATNSIGTGLPSTPSTSVVPSTGNMLYVNAVTGLDTNAGTAAAPFKTITKGLAAATAAGVATTVNVAPGIYSAAASGMGNQAEVFPLKLSSNVTLIGDVNNRGNINTSPTQIYDFYGTATSYTLAAGSLMSGSVKAAIVIPSGVTGATVRGFYIGVAGLDNYEVLIDKATATLDSNYTYAYVTGSASNIANVGIINASNVHLTNNSFDDHNPWVYNSQLLILDSATVVARNNIFNYTSNGENGINVGYNNGLSGISTCTVDLGTAASPGGNIIVPDLGVGLNIQYASNVVQASGNIWLPNVQGASATGTYVVGTSTTTYTTSTSNVNYSVYSYPGTTPGIQF